MEILKLKDKYKLFKTQWDASPKDLSIRRKNNRDWKQGKEFLYSYSNKGK